MPGPILHLGATVQCAHGAPATPGAATPRVQLGGQPAVSMVAPYTVAGCPFVPSGGNGPCATGQWISGATRVLVGGQPAAISTGTSTCTPTSTPLRVVAVQTRVIAA
jgi:uncharacterized Zn-binding protein involved in type VI secretion